MNERMQPNNSQHESKPRNIKEVGPWCWQEKEALRMIRDVCEDGNGHSASELATYLALSELASDAQLETFQAPISLVARRAGVSYRTAANILKRFESLKLIAVARSTVPGTKERAPSTYTMLRNHCATLRKQNQNCLQRSTEESEESNKRTHKAVVSANGLTEEQKQIVTYFNETFVPLGFLAITKITKAVRNILEEKHCTRDRWVELLNNQDCWPRKKTFTSIYWNTRTAAERLQRLPLRVLQEKRQSCIDRLNDLFHRHGKNGKCAPEITAQKNVIRQERDVIDKIINQRTR
jgi:hypothetical protein